MKYIRVAQEVQAHDSAFIAPTAVRIGSVRVRRNASIRRNAVLRGDYEPIEVGEETEL